MKLVYVEWLDHCSTVGPWATIGDLNKLHPLLVRSVGWVLRSNRNYIVIASTRVEDGEQFGGDVLILKSAIVKIKNVRI